MEKYGVAAMIAGLMGIVIFVVVLANVIPTVSTEVAASTNTSNAFSRGQNVTGAGNAMLALTPLIFVATGIVAIVKFLG